MRVEVGSRLTGSRDDRSYSSSRAHLRRFGSAGCNTHHQRVVDTCTVYERIFRWTVSYPFLAPYS